MNEELLSLYNKLRILFIYNDMGEFVIYTTIDEDRLLTKVSCSKYAKFLINDFKSLENDYGKDIYDTIDGEKLKAMFSISEQYQWFTRNELREFLEYVLSA